MILNYYQRGNKDDAVVLFLHGSASDATVWLNELNIISSKGFRCLAFDLRGHGETREKVQPNTVTKLDLDTHVFDVKDTLDYLGIHENVIIVTHSFGGIVAINLAEHYPDLVDRLITVCLPPKLIWPIRKFLGALLGHPLSFIQAHLDLFQQTTLRPRYKSSIMTNAHVLREIFKHVKNWNCYRKISRLKQKIFFAAGRFDLVAPAHMIFQVHERTPYSEFELFKWSSHALMEDEPDKFHKWLLNSCKKDLQLPLKNKIPANKSENAQKQ